MFYSALKFTFAFQSQIMGAEKLSRLAQTLIGSEIVALGAVIKEKIKQGNKIYNYTIGDFDAAVFPIPGELEEEIVQAYRHHHTTYPPADGIIELRDAVASFIKEREGLDYNSNEILIAAGGRPLIYTAFRAIVDKGDKVIYPVPSWNNNHYVHFNEGEHVLIECKLENNFMPTAAEIKPHIKDATLIAVCSPLNPTGTTFTKTELEAICNMVVEENERRGENEKKLYLLYDQIYWTLTFGDTVHYNPVSLHPKMKDYTVFIDGISKAFAATGVRVGWSMGPANLISKMKAINSHVGAWAPMAEQNAVAKFLLRKESLDKWFGSFKAGVEERLRRIYSGFQQLKAEGFAVDAVAPQAAIYLTVQINLAGKKTADGNLLATQADVTDYILNEAKIAVVPFYAFGADKDSSWYRLSVGTCKTEEIDEMLLQLKKSLAGLTG